jgi:hypothetical protein
MNVLQVSKPAHTKSLLRRVHALEAYVATLAPNFHDKNLLFGVKVEA